MKRYEGVIFDLDGVLTDTANLHYKAWKRLCDDIGLRFDEGMNEKLKGIDRMGSLEIILKENKVRFSYEERVAMAEKKNRYYKEMISGITPGDLLPGVPRLLQKLSEVGVKMAVASASRNGLAVLMRLEIIDSFDFIVDANSIEHGKPDPEIFLKASLGLHIPPERCIGIEDSKAGIEAIKRAGMYAIGIGNRDILRGADMVLNGLTETDTIISVLLS